MKRWAAPIFLVAWFHGASTQAQPVLYGSIVERIAGPSTLVELDPTTGVPTPVGDIGFGRCSALEADAAGRLFAVCQRLAQPPEQVLITIDRSTGSGTEIGPLELDCGAIPDISFRADGTLFGYFLCDDSFVVTIDTTTGAGTLVGPTNIVPRPGNGMSFSSGVLYHADDDSLSIHDQTTGEGTAVCELAFPDIPGFHRINAMDAHPSTQVLYASVRHSENGSGEYLATVDTTTCAVTLIGVSDVGAPTLDGVAWLVPPDLALAKSDSPDPLLAGGLLTYTISVENLGLEDATNVVVTDTLPAGTTLVSSTGCEEDPGGAPTCTNASIAAGTTAQLILVVSVSPAFSGTLTNTATVAASPANLDPANDSATTETTVVALDPFVIPTVSSLGLAILALLLVGFGALFTRRV